MIDNMNQYQDEQLKAIIEQALNLLDERDRERKAIAAKKIREMAAQAGLSVEIKTTGKRRGRPRKSVKNQRPEQST